jgi:hypothetical protein
MRAASGTASGSRPAAIKPFFSTAWSQHRPIFTVLAGSDVSIEGNRRTGTMHDIRRDWHSWSRLEQVTVTVAAIISLLVVAIGVV